MSDHRVLIHDAARETTAHYAQLLGAAEWDLEHRELEDMRDERDAVAEDIAAGLREDEELSDIFDEDQAERLAELEALIDEYGRDTYWGEHVLDVRVLVSPRDPQDWTAEFLLTCGGPDVRVLVDSRWSSVTFTHSWGMRADGTDCTRWSLSGADADVWHQFAAEAVEVA